MEDTNLEFEQTNDKSSQKSNQPLIIASIAAVTIVALACITGCILLGYLFIVNAPW